MLTDTFVKENDTFVKKNVTLGNIIKGNPYIFGRLIRFLNMKRVILSLTFVTVVLAGCRKPPDAPLPDRQVIIFFSTKPTVSSSLKSAATQEEEFFSKIMLFGVDNLGNIVETFSVENPPPSGIQRTISKQIKSLYAIANPTTDLEGVSLTTVSALQALTGNFTTAPQPPFMMSGNGNVLGYNVNIELVRTVAKVEMEGVNGFEIESVTVKNTPDKAYVFRRESVSTPSSAVPVNYPAVSLATPTIYLAENRGGLNPTPTQFVVTGQFGDKHANYTVVLADGGENIDIVRNTYYKVYISPLTDSDCIIIITIPEWIDAFDDENPHIIYIPDENFS